MTGLLTIELKQLRFFGYHGLFEEEKRTGNEFEISLTLGIDPGGKIIRDLADTIDYAAIFELVKKRMMIPEPLLETLIMNIAQDIEALYPSVKSIEIGITKMHAPVAGLNGQVGVKYKKDNN